MGVHVALAMSLLPFGDEAWYWQESRALDWSFSDIPLATAALIRAGETIFGHGVFGMRAMFLLLGALIPLILMRTSRRLFGDPAGFCTGTLASLLPLVGLMGVFALPDVPLTFFSVIALDRLEVATRDDRSGAWIGLGIALAGAWLSHYRAAILLAAGLVFLIATSRGRALWRNAKLWSALAISCAGLIPLVVYNARHDWVAVHFQVVERNPWAFHGDALAVPIEQAIVCTPLFYLMLLWAAWRCLRRISSEPWDLLATSAVVPLLLFLVLGFFADDTRFRVHWPIPGYLPLLIAIPYLLHAHWRAPEVRWLSRTSLLVLVAGLVAAYAYLAAATSVELTQRLAGVKAFPEHFVGWNLVGDRTRDLIADDTVLVADNFMLAAELDFAFGGTRTVYSLDHPINVKHGRSPQLAAWKRDEAALRDLGPRHVLLVSEPTARRERDRAEWMSTLCSRVGDLAAVASLDPFGGRKKYRWFSGTLPANAVDDANCDAVIR